MSASQQLPGAALHEGSTADLDTVACVLAEAVRAIEAHGVPYVLLGGLASALLGRPRCSGDVDLFLMPESAPIALEALAGAGFRTERTNPAWIFKAFRREVLVDLIFKARGDIYLDAEMLRRASVQSYRGTSVRVIPPEDLIVIKAIVHDEETPRHWHDALGIIAHAELDWDYLLERANHAPRRVLSLLLYALSEDLWVPVRPLQRLAARVLFDREASWSQPIS
jgi:predicted nucleotidyltransferase